jgi:type IX secretion system PorP/SprF family membrane protein
MRMIHKTPYQNLLIRYFAVFYTGIFSCFFTTAMAQTEPMYSQYMFNMLPLNPAYAGSQENFSLTTTYRKQWVNMDGAPGTQTFSAHSPVKNKNIALGLSTVHDKIGVTSKTGFYGVYAYRINFNNKSKLSFGLQAGFVNVVSRLSQLQTKLPNDPVLSSDKTSYLLPGFGTGLYWYSEKFYLGISSPDLFEMKSKKESDDVIHDRHLFFTGGTVYNISSQVKHMPGFLIKGVKGDRWQYDINNVFIFHDVLWLGVSYRSATSLNFIVQAQLTNQLAFGYAYDTPINNFSRLAGPTHELRLNYKFVFFKDNAFMPRYF